MSDRDAVRRLEPMARSAGVPLKELADLDRILHHRISRNLPLEPTKKSLVDLIPVVGQVAYHVRNRALPFAKEKLYDALLTAYNATAGAAVLYELLR